MIRNLLFDLGNVIIDLDIEGAKDNIAALLLPDKADTNIIEQVIMDYECGRFSTDIFINHFLKMARPGVQAVDVVEAWNSMLVGIPSYRIAMLRALRDKFSVYLISNTNELHLEWIHRHLVRSHEVHKFEKEIFHEGYYSHLVGDRKPNATFFQHIIEDSFITPANTLFVDDIEENIKAAKALGFVTYHVKPGEEIAEYLKLEGYY